MEIYRLEPGTVEIRLPAGVDPQTVLARVMHAGATLSSVNPPIVDGVARVQIPYRATKWDGTVEIHLDFYLDNIQETIDKFINVITPLATIDEIQRHHAITDVEEAKKLELIARKIIESYTAQSFGYSRSIMRVFGQGEDFIRLPQRLNKVHAISSDSYTYDPTLTTVQGDGWILRAHNRGLLEIKQSPPEEYVSVGKIFVPGRNSRKFYEGSALYIDGEWGYYAVPDDVKEAALLLIEDYACKEVKYRDGYLNAITSADWRLDFNSMLYAGTGNARADTLLEKYKIPSVSVI